MRARETSRRQRIQRSAAPLSHLLPLGRTLPRWSTLNVVPQPAVPIGIWSMTLLSMLGKRVNVGPPLSPKLSMLGTVPVKSPVALPVTLPPLLEPMWL